MGTDTEHSGVTKGEVDQAEFSQCIIWSSASVYSVALLNSYASRSHESIRYDVGCQWYSCLMSLERETET